MSAMLAYQALLFINMAMMSETEIEPADAPMAKLLSILLLIGQIAMGVFFVILLVMAIIMAVPSGLREGLIADASSPIDAKSLSTRCFAGAVVSAGWFFVLLVLRRVVAAVIHGDPFLPENVARLRNIWMIIAATEVFRMTAYFIMGGDGSAACAEVDGSRLDIRVGTWFFIFIIAAISEAFRHGAALRAEQELTI